MTDELSNQQPGPDDDELVEAGFCPHCLCPDSTVLSTRRVRCSVIRTIDDERRRVPMLKIVRYRRCENCRRNFRTTEKSV